MNFFLQQWVPLIYKKKRKRGGYRKNRQKQQKQKQNVAK